MPIEDGGIGFLNCRDIHSVAHIASFSGFTDHRQCFINILEENPTIQSVMERRGIFMGRVLESLSHLKSYLKASERSLLSEVLVKLDL